ncbi:MAG: MFS transporter [Pseudomonadota bacterium]
MTAAVPTHPLAIRDYRYYWASRFAAVMATMAMVVVIGWQVYDIARSDYDMSPREAAFQLGLLGLIQFIPLALLTPVAGWVADRIERRRVAQLANMIDLLVALALGFLTAKDMLTLPILFGLAAAHGVARSFVGPAMSAIAPNLVPTKLLPRAIAMSSIAWQSASVLGPAFGGLLYGFQPALPYWLSAAGLLLATLLIGRVKPVQPPPPDRAVHPLRQMADGLRYTWRERFLLGAITLDLFAVLLAGATALLPVYARDILHVGPEGLGQLRAAPALGASAVALFLAFVPINRNVGVKMLWSVVLFGLATIGFGLSTNFLLSLLMLLILGAADMFSVYVRGSLVQLNTPDAMRGRVSAVSGLAISASNELGEMQSGLAAAILGPIGAVVFGGVGAIFVTGLWAWLFPELRNARTFAPQHRDDPHVKEKTP